MHAIITPVYSDRTDWYICHAVINGKRCLGFGASHYSALCDAINTKK